MPFDITHANLTDVWSEETGETVREALDRFATFGPEVPAKDVPALVRAGHRVWSFGYGDDPEDFTTIDPTDLEWFTGEGAEYDDWAPYRLDALDPDNDLVAHYAVEGLNFFAGKWLPPVPKMGIDQALDIIQSRLEAVESVGGRVWTAIDVLNTHIQRVLEEEAAEAANPDRGHVMGHNLCIYCLQYDMDPREDCPERDEELLS